MRFQVFTTVASSLRPAVAEIATMLRVCAVENAWAISVSLNVDGEKVDGENVDGLNVDGENVEGENVDGENVDGLKVDGENVDGLNTEGENVDGLKVDGLYASGLNVDGLKVDGENVDGLNVDGANSAVSLRRSDAPAVAGAVAGLNSLSNAWPMSLNAARS